MTDKCTIRVTLIQGSGLVAKDRNLLGRRTTSDPYVECISTFEKQRKRFASKMGKTVTLYKTLDPKFNHTFPDYDFAYCQSPMIQLRIFDEDKMSDPDAMGTVQIPISTFQDSDTTQWYDVPKDSAKNATGKLQVRLHVKVHKLQQYVTNTNTTTKNNERGAKSGPPKRFINIDGVLKLNPKYLAWKEQNGK
jgi:Ca2+-dependent lipid-binding protein